MNNYILSESLTSTICVYLVLKKLIMPFEQWDAFKLKIIDKNGKKLRHPVTAKERESWDILTRLCWNLKKISEKFVGKSKFATYFTASMLLKDSLNTYIKFNHKKLNETLLSDMTFSKQYIIFNMLKETPQINIHNNLAITQHNNLVEVEIYKLLPLIETLIESNSDFIKIFEDATVAGDIAQLALPIGAEKRTTTKLKKKRKLQ